MTGSIADIRAHLAEIPRLYALLPSASVARVPGGETRSVPGPREPARLGILRLLDTRDRTAWTQGMGHCDPASVGVLPYIRGWALDIESQLLDAGHTELAPLPHRQGVVEWASWLSGVLELAERLAVWPVLAAGITATHGALVGATRLVTGESGSGVPCPLCGSGLTRREGETTVWECAECGHVVSVRAVTLRQASSMVGVPYPTLSGWARDYGLLTPITDGRRQRLYDLGQIRAVVAQRRLSGESA